MSFLKPVSVMQDADRIASLDTSAFSRDDVLNLVLQRSQILESRSDRNRSISAWITGHRTPLLDVIDRVGSDQLVQRAAALIYAEYLALRPILEMQPPRVIADIGCGYGFFDLFVAQDFDCEVNLIDLETSENRHFGFEDSAAAYSNLTVARRFLATNGVAEGRVRTFNPMRDRLADIAPTDLAVSFLSCGFHYPWTSYAAFFRDRVVSGGKICLDIRKRGAEEVLNQLVAYGPVKILPKSNEPKARRVLVRKV